jgi:chromosome segregation ATPase
MTLVEIPDELLLRLYTQKSEEDETALMARLKTMEERMTELSGEVAAQRQAITDLTTRINSLDAGALQARVQELTQAIADRDAAAQALADAEAAEDVTQQADLDRLTTERDDAANRVTDLLGQVQAASDDIAAGVQGIRENTQALSALAQPPA